MANRVGRPSKLAPEITKSLVDNLVKLYPYETACLLSGIGYSTFRRWMIRGQAESKGEYREFWEQMRSAEERAKAALIDDVRKGVKDNPTAAIKLLALRFPNDFVERSKVEHAGKIEHEVRATATFTVVSNVPRAARPETAPPPLAEKLAEAGDAKVSEKGAPADAPAYDPAKGMPSPTGPGPEDRL